MFFADQELFNIAADITVNDCSVYTGTAVSSNAFPTPQELFDKIKIKNPYSIDMETSAIYQIAWLLGIRALAVRGISNLIDKNGTDKNINESDVNGSSEAAAKIVLKIIDEITIKDNLSNKKAYA